ncbi:hypothetical protein J1N35_035024 [Gossypium stocksii]|uniref:Aminotransferase-like plant mobile domain-containing protein n=1 Tax=Gossypium stocksii TaxID=47602 RepID=A0A9D3UUX7_9ROSI|nr:hypothetical protein J1N35_035024 [Gossypium stocksii]
MASELIRLDPTHISVGQLRMHVATIGRGCKLDPKLISALIERWRPETHTFHLPCRECTITLEDVQLQLRLPVDGYAVTGSTQSADWGAVCYEPLGAIPDRIKGGRIEMGWLRDTFPKPDDDSTEVELIRYARAYILQIIRGYLMPDLSRNLVHLRWLLKLVDFRAAGELSWGSAVLTTLYREMCGATFEWTPYEDPAIRAVIPDEFFQNPNIWHIKVPIVTYAIVEMHQSDRVLRQFRFRQPIPVTPEKLDDEHKIDLRQSIRIGQDTGQTISKCGKIGMIIYLLGNQSSFQSWRVCRNTCHGLGSMASHIYCRKRRAHHHSHRAQQQHPTVTEPNSSTNDTDITAFSDDASPMVGWNAWPGSSPFSITPAQPSIYRPSSHEGSHESPSRSSSFYQTPSPYGILPHSPWMMQTPPGLLFYQGGSSSQHPQPDPLAEEPQSPLEEPQHRAKAEPKKNPAPLVGTGSGSENNATSAPSGPGLEVDPYQTHHPTHHQLQCTRSLAGGRHREYIIPSSGRFITSPIGCGLPTSKS